MESADCGAACLAMVAAFYGREVSLQEARELAAVGRGTDALAIVNGGARLGLRGRGVRLDVGQIAHLPPATLLHWNLNHFVVLDRVHKGGIDIVDPAIGPRTVPISEIARHFTGVAVLFEPLEGFAPTPPGRSKVWNYVGQLFLHRKMLARLLVMSGALRVLALALPILTALVVDRVVPRVDYGLLFVVAIGICLCLLVQMLMNLIRAQFLIELRTKLDVKMTVGFVYHLLSLPYAFFTRRSTGDLLLRVSSNSQIRELLATNVLSGLVDGVLVSVYLVLIFFLSPVLGLVTLLLGSLQLTLVLFSRRRYGALATQGLERQARTQAYLVQVIAGIEALKMSGTESRVLEQWANRYVDELNTSLERSRLMAVVEAIGGLLQAGSPIVLMCVGTLIVLQGHMSLGEMLATGALATGFLTPLSGLMASALQLQVLGSYIDRIDDVLASETERKGGAIAPRLSGNIEVDRVSFRYSPNEPLVLNEVSFTISPGSTVAIVGRSGSGKTTLAYLLLGMYLPTAGDIRFDGHSISEIDLKSLRCQMGIVPQSPFIFAGTVRQNICMADPEMSAITVQNAARLAEIDGDIRRMPMGYETPVADAGATLSGGQRQRLALARALAHKPGIVVLDEATSSLDATTEKKVVANIAALGVTRIVIAHRLSTISNADQIIVLDSGRVVEVGTPAQLQTASGYFATLMRDQRPGEADS